jgi:hypothetical protein
MIEPSSHQAWLFYSPLAQQAELITRAVAAQNSDLAVPDASQPVSINISEAKGISATFRIPAVIWCMLVSWA